MKLYFQPVDMDDPEWVFRAVPLLHNYEAPDKCPSCGVEIGMEDYDNVYDEEEDTVTLQCYCDEPLVTVKLPSKESA